MNEDLTEAPVNATSQGYELSTELWRTSRSQVWRGWRRHDRQAVILKILNDEQPSPERLGRFRREYEITGRLQVDGVPIPLGLETSGRGAMLVLADTGAEASDKLLATNGPMAALEATRIALGAARILEQVHAHGLIHKDVNPSNIIVNRRLDRVELIDFELASELGQEDAATNLGHLEGTLAYIAPEQTGRMNRGVDYRADFYGLGASLFQLLTGQPPFTAEDPLALVHSHIAVAPPEVTDIAGGVPHQLSRIVSRLLAKTPEARYQNATALVEDLATCHRALLAGGAIPDFTPGAYDVPQQLQIPQKLYGRGEAIASLTAGFDEAANGGRAAAFVTGAPGIGKSALVGELHKPILANNGNFLSGKFDQLQRDRPYSGLLQAFGELVRQLLATSEDELAAWRSSLQSALGPNGGVLAQLLPEIVEIIGEQPQPAALDAQGERNRFNDTLMRFVAAVVGPERPLVLFLDDLQWADTASLGLLRTLLLDPELGYLYLVGAYRDGEVDASHPLARLIAELGDKNAVPAECHLAGLAEEDVAQLVADTLNTSPASCADLAQQAYSKTLGNPFFLERLLTRWADEGLIWPDRKSGSWRWDSAGVAATNVADNVVELMAEKLHALPQATQQALALAAVLGGQIDLANLAIVARERPADVLNRLWPAVEGDLIRPTDDAYKYVGETGHSGHAWLRFRHDRIQQAALSLLGSNAYRQAQRSVGRLLLQEIADPQTDERLFEALGHLNDVTDLLPGGEERDNLVWLNLIAGERAQRAAAYGPADTFVATGLELLGESGWETTPELTLRLTQRTAETAYMLGEFDRMWTHTDQILAHTSDVAACASAWQLRVQALVLRGDPGAGINEGLRALAKLGVQLRAQPSKAAMLFELVRTRRLLKRVDLAAQAQRGELVEPSYRAIMRLLAVLIAPAYIAQPNLFPILVMRQVQLSVKHGNHPSSCYAFAAYGLLLMALGRPVSEADRFGRLARQLLRDLDAERYRCATNFVATYFIDPWDAELTDVVEGLTTVYDEGLRTGDLQFAAYACHSQSGLKASLGTPLGQMEAFQAENKRRIQKLGQQASADMLRPPQQWVYNLHHILDDPTKLKGPHVNEDVDFDYFQSQNNNVAVFGLCEAKALCAYHYDSLAELGPWLEIMQRKAKTNRASAVYLQGYSNFVAIRAAYASEGHGAADLRTRRHLRRCLKDLEDTLGKIANPACYRPFVNLARGEVRRLEGRFDDALAAFEAAVEGASARNYHHMAGLGRERAARLLEARNLPDLAKAFIQDALVAYAQWEAHGKIAFLRQRYQILGTGGTDTLASSPATRGTANVTQSVTKEGDQDLDLEAVVRAAQTISQEIRPAQLAGTLMEVVGQTAGATHGALLLSDREVHLRPQALLDSDQTSSVSVLVDQPDAAPQPGGIVPLAAVRYALRRRELVAVDNAGEDRNYSYDPYIKAHQPKSILCLPLVNQGRVTGLLYVEHRHLSGAFPASRTTLLGLLSAQMAVSLENAQLYSDMEAQVAARTHELEQTAEALRQEKAETERAHQVIHDSLETARRMQRAALPEATAAELGLADLACVWQPRDQVGGDFYRVAQDSRGSQVALVVMDCTGHGVPGALLSFVATSAADRALQETQDWDPAELLQRLDRLVRSQLHGQMEADPGETDHTATDDGLEAAVCVAEPATGRLRFAGAGIHLFTSRTGSVAVTRGARGPLGYRTVAAPSGLATTELDGGADVHFLTTDGLLEQTGGPKGLQLARRRFARILADTRDAADLAERTRRIREAVEVWQGNEPQRDDLTLIGLRLSAGSK